MKERPILFSAPMVRALLDGRKTQTRRIVKLPKVIAPRGNWEPSTFGGCGVTDSNGHVVPEQGCIWHTHTGKVVACPHGLIGDRLWVRETFVKIAGQTMPWIATDYRATYNHGDRLGDLLGVKKRWTPAIHMPRAASRITLEVTEVRVERLQDISESDCWAEGIEEVMHDFSQESQIDMANRLGCVIDDAKPLYAQLWEQINGARSWDANPYVWVIEFKRVKP